ncbi:hypothetical protein EDD15DRAFT_2176624 [Pisolithus albus]|nr:hypothetical protein EDD15DRAFT_2176624 [Pisolithus albus]
MYFRKLTLYSSCTSPRPRRYTQQLFTLTKSEARQLKDYVTEWPQFQSPCNLEAEYIFNWLSNSLAHWQQLLTEINKACSTLDISGTECGFWPGACIIHCSHLSTLRFLR